MFSCNNEKEFSSIQLDGNFLRNGEVVALLNAFENLLKENKDSE